MRAIAIIAISLPLHAQFVQQGSKLKGNDAVGGAVDQGYSVGLSSDGNTAVVGGPIDNTNTGAAWVYTRSSGAWTQQGKKLVGTTSAGPSQQGTSVAISGDGNTILVGGPADSGSGGAAWVFTRSGGNWTQFGPKLAPPDGSGAAFGTSVALTPDGATAVIGGPHDNGSAGAVWVFTRGSSGYSVAGPKLSLGTSFLELGYSVAVSSNGATIVAGAPFDNGTTGSAYVFARSGNTWSQQAQLSGSAASGNPQQGRSVAISSDGSTAIVGGPLDRDSNSGPAGAAWVFTRNVNNTWVQQGVKLVATNSAHAPELGSGIALSPDGNTAVIGGPLDCPNGSAWLFTRVNGHWVQGQKLVATGPPHRRR